MKNTNHKPIFFKSAAEWRAWLVAHHDHETEVLVGYYKKATGKPSLTWPESVDEALCYGWIDGIRRRVDENSYSIRFTPRKVKSNWSLVNVRRVGELIKAGRMMPAGLKAFEARVAEKSGVYSFEQSKAPQLTATQTRAFRLNAKAWKFFQAQPASYRKTAIWWVVSAKQEATRARRLATLIEDSAHERRLAHLTRTPKAK